MSSAENDIYRENHTDYRDLKQDHCLNCGRELKPSFFVREFCSQRCQDNYEKK